MYNEKNIRLLGVLLLLVFHTLTICAVEKRTIHVATAGTLPDYISESEKYEIEELTLTGELNGTDFRLLRDMSRCNYKGDDTQGVLKVLDLSGTKIVAGGEKYVDAERLPRWGDCSYTVDKNDVLPQHVFHGCKLTNVTIPTSVTSIGDYAFFSCEIKSILIPNSVKSIGNGAFEYCSGLTSITIPNSVTRIGTSAFADCFSLTSITIPNSTTSIGDFVFSGCSKLVTINVENGNIKYDSRDGCNAIIETSTNTLFAGCKNTSIPNSVTRIGQYAFYGCTALSSIKIPNSVISIANSAFSICTGLSSITIPNSVATIGKYAFNNCTSLFTIISEITNPFEISETVFPDYSKPTLTVPSGTKAAYQATNYWNKFANIVENSSSDSQTKRTIHVATAGTLPDYISESEKYEIEELTLTGELNGTDFRLLREMAGCNYTGVKTQGKLTVLDLSGTKVVAGGENYYNRFGSITKFVIDKNDTLPQDVFYGCNFSAIRIPNSLKCIEGFAFEKCTSLSSITIPNSVISIGNGAFAYCSGLLTMIVENSNARYDSRNDCNAIIETSSNTLIAGCKSTIIPNSVTSIGSSAFYGCSGLSSITIPNSVTSIGDEAFYNCSGLLSITIPNSLTSIGKSAFQSCSGLLSITIPNSLTSIGKSAFSGCRGLSSITIPNSVISIGNSAFNSCSGLSTIIVENNNARYDSRNDCNAIIETSSNTLIAGCKNTIIPNSVTSIGSSAFYGCSGLSSIIIPSSVTNIGYNAFCYCSGLTSITIPNSVTCIENDAFAGCNNLTSIISEINDPFEISETVFSNYSQPLLIVPNGKKAEYQATNYWNKFANIVDSNTEYTLSIKSTGNGSVVYNKTTICNQTTLFSLNEGTNVTLKITPNNLYRVKSMMVNSTDATWSISNNQYTINNISEDTSVEVEFEEQPDNLLIDNFPPQNAYIDMCDTRVVFKTSWSQFYDYVLTQRLDSMTKEEFDACYEPDLLAENIGITATGIVIGQLNIFSNYVRKGDAFAKNNLGYASYYQDIGTPYYCFTWELTAEECEQLTHDKANYPILVYRCIRFKEKPGVNPRPKFPYIFILMPVKLERRDITVTYKNKNNNYWFGLDGSDTGWDAIKFELKELTTEGDNTQYYYDIRTTMVDNTVKMSNAKYKYYFAPKNVEIMARNGKNYTITAQSYIGDVKWNRLYCKYFVDLNEDSHLWDEAQLDDIIHKCAIDYSKGALTNEKLYALYNGTYTQIATLNQSTGEISLIRNEQCEDILNVTGYIGNHANINTGMRTWVAVVAKQYSWCDIATKVTYENASDSLRSFLVAWQHPGKADIIKGDVSGDGIVNVSDIVAVVNYILGKATEDFDEAVVDMNGDGIVNVTDVVMMVSIIMSGQYDAARSPKEIVEATTDSDRLTLTKNGGNSLSLRLENEGGYVATQFEVRIDAGMMLESITMNDQRSGGHQLIYAKTGDNIYKVIVYSVSNTAFGGHDGELLSICTKGSGNVTLDNILFVTDGQKEKRFTSLYGNTTGIETIQPSTTIIQNSYDLQGRKAENVQLKRGVYIKNGKKQVVR